MFLDGGAAANFAHLKWPQRHDALLAKYGIRAAKTHPAAAIFKFGKGELAAARHAADVPVAIAGRCAMLTTLPVPVDCMVRLHGANILSLPLHGICRVNVSTLRNWVMMFRSS